MAAPGKTKRLLVGGVAVLLFLTVILIAKAPTHWRARRGIAPPVQMSAGGAGGAGGAGESGVASVTCGVGGGEGLSEGRARRVEEGIGDAGGGGVGGGEEELASGGGFGEGADGLESGCEWVAGGASLEDADAEGGFLARLRRRGVVRLHRGDAPWADTRLLGGERVRELCNLNASDWPCNPGGGSCACLRAWSGRDVCGMVAHRQKPALEVTFSTGDQPAMQGSEHPLDCPTVRCTARVSRNHSEGSRALVQWLGYAQMYVTARFPPKVSPAWNRNVLVSFESSARYAQLNESRFHKAAGVDLHAAHTPLGPPVPLLTSFADLPASHYREAGSSFEERSERVAFFVTNCKGPARTRYFLIDELTRLMPLDSFRHGTCLWWNASQVTMERDWPQCVRTDVGDKQARRYAEKECVLGASRLTLIVENSWEEDYVSEKLYQALRMGCVPIYKGAPNAAALLPHPDAAILLDAFPSLGKAAAYARRVNADRALWLKHTAWKRQPLSPDFAAVLSREFSLCSVCEHYAADARGAGITTLPRVGGGGVSACALRALAAARGSGSAVHVAHAHAGVDAVFAIGAPTESAVQAIRALFGVPPVVVRRGLADPEGCLAVAPCGGVECKGACGSHLLVAYLSVLHGLQNVIVFPGELDFGEGGQGVRGRIDLVLHALPVGYSVAALGCGGVGADGWGCGIGPYVMSQRGARSMLLGKKGGVILNKVEPVFSGGCPPT